MSRFDYVKYDEASVADQNEAKELCSRLEVFIDSLGTDDAHPGEMREACGRSKALALTKLEEVYMWIGKAVRDDQIQRNGSAELQEGRKNG